MSVSRSADRASDLRVAVIGAERVGHLENVIRTLPERSGFAIVVVSRMASNLAEALRPISSFSIIEARERARLASDQVFVVPHDCEAEFHRDELVVTPAAQPRGPLDKLLRSLADEHGASGMAVILSGRGDDGVLGIKRVKEAGGLTIAQRPEDDDDMPCSAIATGMVDLVLPLSAIVDRLVTFGRKLGDDAPLALETERRGPDAMADTLHDILSLVRIRSGHDFGSYKRATLYRRVARRTQVCQCDSIAAYHQYLREHPDELPHLLRDFLISVTNFFRDRAAFAALAGTAIPKMFAGKTSADHVRVWVPGCATGEEAYSIGMLLLEHAGKLAGAPQLHIFATDIDEDALAEARVGRYPSTIAVDVTPERLQRFFVPDGHHHRVGKELRELVLFSPHNVLRDPPFSRLDLVSCRNLLIYLNRDAQDRVLHAFHFALRPEGFLFIGSSESAENTAIFTAVDAKHRLFTRQTTLPSSAADSLVTQGRWHPLPLAGPAVRRVERIGPGELHLQLVERHAPPSVLIDEELDILHVSERASRLLQVAPGEPTRQLPRMIHPALRLDLRTAIYAARQSPRGSDSRVVRFDDAGTPRAIEIRVRAVNQPGLGRGTLLVMFDELEPSGAGPERSSGTALEPMMHELEDELRQTREQLRITVEQYETSVEELKASNEELHAINEELRSASEELETSKEELQSVNEELTTLNHELSMKVDEVSHANSDLQNLMTSTDIGVVFLDRGLNIKRFTPRAQDLFNVIPGDLGRPLAHVTHRLDTSDLPQLAQSVLQTLRVAEREVTSHDGRRYLARLLPYRSLEDRIGGVVLTFVEVSDLRNAVDARDRSEAARQTSDERLGLALRHAPMLVVSQDHQLRTSWGYFLGKELAAGSPELGELFAPGGAERFTEVARRVLRTGHGERVELDLVIHGEPRTYDLRIERSELGVDTVGFDISPRGVVA